MERPRPELTASLGRDVGRGASPGHAASAGQQIASGHSSPVSSTSRRTLGRLPQPPRRPSQTPFHWQTRALVIAIGSEHS